MQRVFEEHKEIYPWMTIDLVKKGLKKTKKDVVVVNNSAISELTNPIFECSNQENNEPAEPPPMNISINQELEIPLESSNQKGGWPCSWQYNAGIEGERRQGGGVIK